MPCSLYLEEGLVCRVVDGVISQMHVRKGVISVYQCDGLVRRAGVHQRCLQLSARIAVRNVSYDVFVMFTRQRQRRASQVLSGAWRTALPIISSSVLSLLIILSFRRPLKARRPTLGRDVVLS